MASYVSVRRKEVVLKDYIERIKKDENIWYQNVGDAVEGAASK